jgi:hypothetical protein
MKWNPFKAIQVNKAKHIFDRTDAISGVLDGCQSVTDMCVVLHTGCNDTECVCACVRVHSDNSHKSKQTGGYHALSIPTCWNY